MAPILCLRTSSAHFQGGATPLAKRPVALLLGYRRVGNNVSGGFCWRIQAIANYQIVFQLRTRAMSDKHCV